MDLDLMINSFPKLLNATLTTVPFGSNIVLTLLTLQLVLVLHFHHSSASSWVSTIISDHSRGPSVLGFPELGSQRSRLVASNCLMLNCPLSVHIIFPLSFVIFFITHFRVNVKEYFQFFLFYFHINKGRPKAPLVVILRERLVPLFFLMRRGYCLRGRFCSTG